MGTPAADESVASTRWCRQAPTSTCWRPASTKEDQCRGHHQPSLPRPASLHSRSANGATTTPPPTSRPDIPATLQMTQSAIPNGFAC